MKVKLVALSSICGDYTGGSATGYRAGLVHAGETFEASESDALALESRGLAYRYFEPAPMQSQYTYDTASFMPQYATKAIVADEIKPITARRKRT
jgi:hypothetical protein